MSHDWFDGLGSEAPHPRRSPPRKQRAKRGRKVTFHGAFKDKATARAKERQVHGFIRTKTIGGHRRYVVMTRNEG